ncbi:ABC transporter ATP-binding protein [Yunchengibacter salinarum]|uniref:ABC transporter ATP-binding protein n=1 Tax=Yunchengibacter salinarum TaxID=3133399 RepID=UPI0035B6A4DA
MTEQADNVIRVRGLKTGFGKHVVHDGLDLDMRRGEILGIVGGSGTGKSVLLRAIVGLLKPWAGDIRFNCPGMARGQRDGRRLGVLFQDGALFSSLTVAQNIQVPLREHYHLSRHLLDDLARSKVEMVGLPLDAARQYPSGLSGGMRKRAALARALALDPEVLFLDEPTAGLDPIGASGIDRLVKELRDNLGLSVFLVTHDLDTLVSICDRIAVLGEKRILINAPLAQVRAFDHPWVQDYFNGPRGRSAEEAAALGATKE